MIKSLPKFHHAGSKGNTNAWRRLAGKMRAEMLIAQDAYATIMNPDSTVKERERAMDKLLSYTNHVTYLQCMWDKSKFSFIEFVQDDEKWK